MKLGNGVEAAIHCVTAISSLPEGAVLPAQAMAERFGQSQSYLLKHLKALVKNGILDSVPGPTGGYRLGRPGIEITLLDIVLAVEGQAPAFRCSEIRRAGLGLPNDAFPAPCGINTAMLRAERAYRKVLAEVTVAALVAEYDAEADPRVKQRGCAFVEQALRQQPSEN